MNDVRWTIHLQVKRKERAIALLQAMLTASGLELAVDEDVRPYWKDPSVFVFHALSSHTDIADALRSVARISSTYTVNLTRSEYPSPHEDLSIIYSRGDHKATKHNGLSWMHVEGDFSISI